MSDDNRVARPIVEAIDAAAVRLKRENADLRAMLREIRRTVIASVRGEEHAAALTDEEVDAHAASTPVDVGNLVARMRSAEAERDALSIFSRNNEAALASAVDQLALLRAQVAALTDEELNAIEARANAATGGEWGIVGDEVGVVDGDDGDDETCRYIDGGVVLTLPTGYVINRGANAAFLVRARADVLALVAEVRRLTTERDAAFTRGVEAMREAAVNVCETRAENHKVDARRSPNGQRAEWQLLAGDQIMAASEIRALKVSP